MDSNEEGSKFTANWTESDDLSGPVNRSNVSCDIFVWGEMEMR